MLVVLVLALTWVLGYARAEAEEGESETEHNADDVAQGCAWNKAVQRSQRVRSQQAHHIVDLQEHEAQRSTRPAPGAAADKNTALT